MGNIFVIEHDNGVKGQKGFSDYTMSEVWEKGGINAILSEYREHGIHVYRWYTISE